MDGENHGKPHFLMDDLGETTLFSESIRIGFTGVTCEFLDLQIKGGPSDGHAR